MYHLFMLYKADLDFPFTQAVSLVLFCFVIVIVPFFLSFFLFIRPSLPFLSFIFRSLSIWRVGVADNFLLLL